MRTCVICKRGGLIYTGIESAPTIAICADCADKAGLMVKPVRYKPYSETKEECKRITEETISAMHKGQFRTEQVVLCDCEQPVMVNGACLACFSKAAHQLPPPKKNEHDQKMNKTCVICHAPCNGDCLGPYAMCEKCQSIQRGMDSNTANTGAIARMIDLSAKANALRIEPIEGSGQSMKMSEPQEVAVRYDQNKLDWSLVPMQHLEGMVRVLMFGTKKYAPHNWRKGFLPSRITNSLQRHLNAFNTGEDIDPESGLPHTAHILCNALFLAGNQAEHPEMDDRYKPEPTNHEGLERQ